ncbi:MAG: HAMP domain-containing protein [Betaproteobacteria bacterium]|nr:HAMP domain-containing protein [Betaproteobacteria bacterium]
MPPIPCARENSRADRAFGRIAHRLRETAALPSSLSARYLFISLLAALVPLAATVILYDRFAAGLVLRLADERVESRLLAAANKLSDFLKTKAFQLEALADLPELADIVHGDPQPLDARLLSLLRHETDVPDLYGVLFFDAAGRVVAAVPEPGAAGSPLSSEQDVRLEALPRVEFQEVELIGPLLPSDGRPGWLLLRRRLGAGPISVGLQIRLASVTELLTGSALDVYRPALHTPGGRVFSEVGTELRIEAPLIHGPEIAPGWFPAMLREAAELPSPGATVRYIMLGLALGSAGVLVVLFLRLGARIRRRISPLVAGAESVARGELALEVPVEGRDEIAALGGAFNRMSAQLRTLIQARVETEKRAVLGEFAAGVAHEVRNPLATIKTSIQALGARETEPARRELVGLVVEEIERINGVIEGLLTFARPHEPEKHPATAGELLRRVAALAGPLAEESAIAISMLGERDLRFFLDLGQVQQILMNLVLNALQAMPGGGVLTLRAYRDGENGCLAVSDTGPGIGPELMEKVTEPFFTTKPGGTGLGLAISRQLAEMNGGTIEIASAAGAGTTVTVRLPLAEEGNHEDLAAGSHH